MNVIDEIATERTRQINEEGWDSAHDDEHDDESLAQAAACYAMPDSARCFKRQRDNGHRIRDSGKVPKLWPRSWA